MDPSEILVSVVMPVYNGEKFLAAAIESVLTQAHRPLEIVVVDDGSTDNSAQIAQRYAPEVYYFYQDNAGPPAARNHALRQARGALIGFLDADDLWAKDKLEKQLPYFADSDTHIVVGQTQRMWAKIGSEAYVNFTPPELAMKLGASLFKRAAFDQVGSFDTELRYCDDWDWFMRARELALPIVVDPHTAVFYRRHESNLTQDEAEANKHFLLILKKSLDRRRQQGIGAALPLPKLSDFFTPHPDGAGK